MAALQLNLKTEELTCLCMCVDVHVRGTGREGLYSALPVVRCAAGISLTDPELHPCAFVCTERGWGEIMNTVC